MSPPVDQVTFDGGASAFAPERVLDEAAARRSLRGQVTRLERELSRIVAGACEGVFMYSALRWVMFAKRAERPPTR